MEFIEHELGKGMLFEFYPESNVGLMKEGSQKLDSFLDRNWSRAV
jgi:hypothetical protein